MFRQFVLAAALLATPALAQEPNPADLALVALFGVAEGAHINLGTWSLNSGLVRRVTTGVVVIDSKKGSPAVLHAVEVEPCRFRIEILAEGMAAWPEIDVKMLTGIDYEFKSASDGLNEYSIALEGAEGLMRVYVIQTGGFSPGGSRLGLSTSMNEADLSAAATALLAACRE